MWEEFISFFLLYILYAFWSFGILGAHFDNSSRPISLTFYFFVALPIVVLHSILVIGFVCAGGVAYYLILLHIPLITLIMFVLGTLLYKNRLMELIFDEIHL